MLDGPGASWTHRIGSHSVRLAASRAPIALLLLVLAACDAGYDADLPVGRPRDAAPVPASHRRATPTTLPVPEAAPEAGDDEAEAPVPSLVVDHAWVKDADTLLAQQERRRAMDQLRVNVGRGMTFEAAWVALRVAPEVWHIGEHETYPVAVIPVEARNLPVGTLSPVIPGDGGLHLFRILGREGAE